MALAETKLFPKNTYKSYIGATGQQRNRQQVRKSSLIHYKIMIDIKLCNFSLKHRPQDHNLQYSSQIVETGAICLEFSPNFLHSLLTPSFSLTFAPLLPQCWAGRILKQ